MAAQIYEVFFGTANAAGSPVWARFSRADTHADLLPHPVFTTVGNGVFSYPYDWSTSPVAAVEYVATLNGVELFGVINSSTQPGTTTVVAQTLNLNSYSTAGTILNRVAVQVGLASRTDPFDNIDANFVRLVEFLTTVGDDLSIAHDWAHLIKEFSFVTDGTTQSYALPADFHEIIDQTTWNRTTRLPMVGPLSPQQTQFLKARLPTIVVNVTFRIQGNLLTLPIVPPTGATCAAEYVSTFWVKSASGVAADMDHPGTKDDVCLHDPSLLVRAVKLQYLQSIGMDTTAAQREYDAVLQHCIGKNVGAQILSLGRVGRNTFDRMIDGRNIPEGYW